MTTTTTTTFRKRLDIAERARLVILKNCGDGDPESYFYIGSRSRELLRVARLYGQGVPILEISRRLKLSRRTINRRIQTLKNLARFGTATPPPQPSVEPKTTAPIPPVNGIVDEAWMAEHTGGYTISLPDYPQPKRRRLIWDRKRQTL